MSKRAAPITMSTSKRGKLDPMVVGVMEALDGASCLNETCKAMLRAACPFSLGLPAKKRQESHKDVVNMIGEVLASSANQLESAIAAIDSKIADLEGKKLELCQVAQDKMSESRGMTKAVTEKQQEAAAASLAAVAADEIFRQCMETQREGDKQAIALNDEKFRLENAIEQHLKPVQLEELEESVAEKHAQALLALNERLTLDEALLASMPKACVKAKSSRGVFDVMVLDALAESLHTQLASLVEQVAAEAPGVTQRSEALTEALQAVEATAEARRCRAEALEAARAAEKEQRAQVTAAETQVLTMEVEIEKAGKDRSSATSALEEFKAWPLECFHMLKDKAPVAEAAGA